MLAAMTLALLVAALSTSSLPDAPHSGWLLAQAPPPPASPALEREVTIKALREELDDLRDQRSSIGYVFPILCIGVGVGLVVLGSVVKTSETWLNETLLISGSVIAGLSTLWLILRIARSVSLGSQISDKEEQLRQLEDQRLRVSVVPLRGGGIFAGLQLTL
jgi:hypothetical protein